MRHVVGYTFGLLFAIVGTLVGMDLAWAGFSSVLHGGFEVGAFWGCVGCFVGCFVAIMGTLAGHYRKAVHQQASWAGQSNGQPS